MSVKKCPCGGDEYEACCGPLHDGARQAETAEELMRSRYSAYALGLHDYVFRTWHPRTRPQGDDDSGVRWTSLTLIDVVDGQPWDTSGIVEFEAAYELGGRRGVLHERSTFERRAGRWFYVEAV